MMVSLLCGKDLISYFAHYYTFYCVDRAGPDRHTHPQRYHSNLLGRLLDDAYASDLR